MTGTDGGAVWYEEVPDDENEPGGHDDGLCSLYFQPPISLRLCCFVVIVCEAVEYLLAVFLLN